MIDESDFSNLTAVKNLINDMECDLVRVSRLNESLRIANGVLVKENNELKIKLETIRRYLDE